jgi:hypothetical protein
VVLGGVVEVEVYQVVRRIFVRKSVVVASGRIISGEIVVSGGYVDGSA